MCICLYVWICVFEHFCYELKICDLFHYSLFIFVKHCLYFIVWSLKLKDQCATLILDSVLWMLQLIRHSTWSLMMITEGRKWKQPRRKRTSILWMKSLFFKNLSILLGMVRQHGGQLKIVGGKMLTESTLPSKEEN